MSIQLRPIGFVRAARTEVLDDEWDSVAARVELADDVPDEALRGLETFSHVELVLFADRATDVPPAPWSRHPRGNPEWPNVGIFAQRNKDRPNRLLVSVAAIEQVSARFVVLRGLDAIDGTPVLDIKPWFSWSGPRGDVVAPAWSHALGEGYF
jgi:tRNA (Thr-GGU) A37 N-methylase